MSQNIQVFVRCRPLNQQEKRSVVQAVPDKREVKVLDRNSNSTSYDTKNFYFDQVFAPDAKQIDIYKTVVSPLIEQVLIGFNCTVFAYGQTGTGKTYTMEGDRSDKELSWEEDPHCGIIPRAISQLFDNLKDIDNEFTVRVSFLELYNEDTYDLLSSLDDTTKLKIFEDAHKKGSVIVGGLEEIIVKSKAEIYEILKRGSAKRQTAATLLNACSSRSHTIFSVTVHIREGSIEGEELLKIGKLNLVDLAGSENIGRSGAQDKRAREAGNINQSLLTLGRVITALVEKRPHIPYRESKLTRLLQDSLGGKTKTSIIATISPALLDLEDTLSTLDYASRAKKITNKPQMNQKLTIKALLKEYTAEIDRLSKDLKATREKSGVYIEEENYKEMCKQLSAKNTAVQEKEERLAGLQEEIEKNRKLFEDFTILHEQTKDELTKTKADCELQKTLIDAHRKDKKKLISQTNGLIQVAKSATNDIHLLHSKKERIENILKENRSTLDRYYPRIQDNISRIANEIDLYARDLESSANPSFYEEEDQPNLVDLVSQSTNVYTEIAEMQNNQSQNYKNLAEDLKLQKQYHETMIINLTKKIDLNLQLAKDCENKADYYVAQGEQMSNLVKEKVALKSKLKIEAQQYTEEVLQKSSALGFTVKKEVDSLQRDLHAFFTREIKEDVKTGLTPQKKTYDIPKSVEGRVLCDSISEETF